MILAFSHESDLGIDTEIERLTHDFELRFEIGKTKYQVSKVLFDAGADATCSSGTRVFRVVDKTSLSGVSRVVKDSWVDSQKTDNWEPTPSLAPDQKGPTRSPLGPSH